MELSKCLGCMNPFRGYPCPTCGYDPQKGREAEYALPPGTILAGKYLVGRVLGQGGFGITYIGLDIALERKVAIKECYPSGQANRAPGTSAVIWPGSEQVRTELLGGMEMVLKEARKMVKVEEVPGVVKVRELFRGNNTAYIVMDYVEGETLKDRLRKAGPMPWSQAKKIFLPVIRTMESVHQAGIIHRDLSPDNLMLTPGGAVKVLDLGAAKDITVNTGASSMPVAKSGFSPLEQYGQQGGSGPYTDVYALAATLYYTLTGKVPLPALDRINNDQLNWDYPGLKAAPENVRQALRKALALRPEQRTRSMADFYAHLAAETPEKRKMPPRDVCVAAIFAATALCLLLSVFAASLVRRRMPSVLTVPESTAVPSISVPRSTSGSGTKSDPYRLASPEDLERLREHPDAYFLLTQDISMDTTAFTPVPSFSGTLDGGSHWILGLSIVFSETESASGLFVTIEETGIVKNLSLDVSMDAKTVPEYVTPYGKAGLAETNNGTISGCTIQSRLVNGDNYSAVAASNSGTIENCFTNTLSTNCRRVNGVTSGNDGTLFGNTVKLEATGSVVYGIAWRNWSAVENCTVEVQVKECSGFYGISTQNYAPIKNCSVTGTITTIDGSVECYSVCNLPGYGSEIIGGNYHVVDSRTNQVIPIIPDGSEAAEEPTVAEITVPTTSTEPTAPVSTDPGSGTMEDPYRLYSAADLELLRTYSSAYFRLERDIDLGGTAFTPLGVFNGTLDGNGHVLSGLSYEFVKSMTSGIEVAALFKDVGTEGVVKNLKVSCAMNAGDLETTYAAGITICNAGLIDHCTVIAQVSGCSAFGGITRLNKKGGSITHCAVTVTADNCKFVGGIAEYQKSGSVTNCSAYVQMTDVTSMGGIAYANEGSIQNCSADGSVQTSITIGILASLVGENIKDGTVSESTGSIINSATGKTLPAIGHQA